MYFNIIASGSKGNATIVVSKQTVILIDMGITFSRLEEGMKEINLDPKDIDGAIFTHNHSDHIAGLKFIPVKKQYALKGTLPTMNHNVCELFTPFNIKNITITPIKASHDAINPCGFILFDGEEKLVYLTDTGVFLEENLKYCSNPDYLIIESNHDIQMLLKTNRPMELKQRILSDHGHLCNEDGAIAAKEILGPKTKEIIPAHLSEEANTPEKCLEAWNNIFNYFGLDISKYNVRPANQWKSLLGGRYEN